MVRNEPAGIQMIGWHSFRKELAPFEGEHLSVRVQGSMSKVRPITRRQSENLLRLETPTKPFSVKK